MMLDRRRAQLLVIDMQERLLPAMAGTETVLERSRIVVAAAQRLEVPILFTEQYPRGLGHTDPNLLETALEPPVLEKVTFSAARTREMAELVELRRDAGRDQLVIVGIEAHVCVLQTALDFAERTLSVAVVADATSSRKDSDRSCGLGRLEKNGVAIVTSEMVVFEWLGAAGTPEFKDLSALLK